MTISVLTTRTTFEHCLGIIRQASVEILLMLGVHASDGKDPRWNCCAIINRYSILKRTLKRPTTVSKYAQNGSYARLS